MSFDDDLRELSEYVGDRYSELDPDPLGEELTQANVRFDDLMRRSGASPAPVASDPVETPHQPDVGQQPATAAVAAATLPLREDTPPPVEQKPPAKRNRATLWLIAGAALTAGFGVGALKMSWSSDDPTAGAADATDPVVVDAPVPSAAEISAALASSAMAAEEPSASDTEANAEQEVPSAEATAEATSGEADVADDTEAAAETDTTDEEKSTPPPRRRVTKPRPQKRKKKQFVPSGL
jgi:hypothetical protein